MDDLDDPARQSTEPSSAPRNIFDRMSAPAVAFPLLFVYGAALFLLTLGTYPLYTKGEPREAETILEMVNGSGIILPMRAGIEVPSKPLLMHWTAAIAAVVAGGLDERIVRFPSALFAIAGILACYFYVRLLFDSSIALVAALILGSTFQYLQAGTAARVDMTLTFFMEVAFFEFLLIAEGLTRRRMLLYVAIALAVLSKGPVGLALPAATAAAFVVVQRRWDLPRTLALGRGTAVVAVLAGSWYVAAAIVGGREFIDRQILAENVFRLVPLGEFAEGHAHPFYYLELALLAGFMPWTAMLPVAALEAAVRRARRVDARMQYLLIWFAVVLLFYSFAQSKRAVYLLALYPALATLVAVYLIDLMRTCDGAPILTRLTAVAAGVGFLAAGTGGIIAAVAMLVWPPALEAMLALVGIRASGFVGALREAVVTGSYLAAPFAVVTMVAGIALLSGRASIERLVAATAAGFAAASIATNLVVLPALGNALGLKQFASDAMKIVGGAPAAYLHGLNYGFAYYSGRNFPVVAARDGASVPYLIAAKQSWDTLKPSRRAPFEVVLTSNPTELDGRGEMVLLRRKEPAPDFPAADAPRS